MQTRQSNLWPLMTQFIVCGVVGVISSPLDSTRKTVGSLRLMTQMLDTNICLPTPNIHFNASCLCYLLLLYFEILK